VFSDQFHQGSPVGECAACGFYPIVPNPSLAGLKLCVFTGTHDYVADVNYTSAAEILASWWGQSGGVVRMHLERDYGHTDVRDWGQFLDCMQSSGDGALPGSR